MDELKKKAKLSKKLADKSGTLLASVSLNKEAPLVKDNQSNIEYEQLTQEQKDFLKKYEISNDQINGILRKLENFRIKVKINPLIASLS